MGALSIVEEVLGWAEYIVIIAALVEIGIAGWKATQGEINESLRKWFWALAGIVAMLSIVNLAINSINLGPINNLPGSEYIYALGIAGVGFGAIYGGYLLVKNELEHGMEMLILSVLIAVLMSSASYLFQNTNVAATINQLISGANQVSFTNPTVSLYYFLTALPTKTNGGPLWSTMQTVFGDIQPVAEALIVIAFVVLAVWKFLFEGENELYQYLAGIVRDLAIAVIVVFGALDIYNLFATIIDGLAYELGQLGGISFIQTAIGGLATIAVSAAATGYFVPYVADFVGNMTDVFMFAIDLAAIKFAVVSLLGAFAPLFAAFYLFPPTRRVSQLALDIFVGMSIGGVMAGAMLAFLSNFVNDLINISIAGFNVAQLILDPLLLSALPYILPIFIMTGGGGGGGWRGGGRGGRGSSSSSGQTTTVVTTNSTQQGQAGDTTLVKPVPQSRGVLGRMWERFKNREMEVTGTVNDQFPEKLRGYKKVDERQVPDQATVDKFNEEVALMDKMLQKTFPNMPESLRRKTIEKIKEEKAKEYGLEKVPGTDEYAPKKIAKYKESIPHALGSAALEGLKGMGENLLANAPVMIQAMTRRMDDFLASRVGSSVLTPTIGAGSQQAATWLWKKVYGKKPKEKRQ